MFNLLQPYAITVSTPSELQPYGWTTTDLWCAPLITGLYATLTHAQPYWADLHYALLGWVGPAPAGEDGFVKVAPVDPETARATCAPVLAALFGARTWKMYSGVTAEQKTKEGVRKESVTRTVVIEEYESFEHQKEE